MVWYWWQIWLIYWWNFVGSAPQWALDGAPTAEYLVWILNCHILSELIWVISDIFMAHHVISQPSEHEHHEPFKYCGPCCHLPLVTYVWSMHKKGHSTWFFFQSAAQKQSPELGEFTGRNEFARRAYLKKKKELTALCRMERMRGRDATGSTAKHNKQETYLDTERHSIFIKKYKLTVALRKSIMILCVHLNRVAWQQK